LIIRMDFCLRCANRRRACHGGNRHFGLLNHRRGQPEIIKYTIEATTSASASRLFNWLDDKFRCLIPAAPAVPAAAKQQNDNYDDEKRGGIHVELLLAVRMHSHYNQPF
jgi:hypothetical protein